MAPLTTDLVTRLREVRVSVDQAGDHYREAPALDLEAADEIERLRGEVNNLAHLLRYAAQHSSVAPLMNDSWREDSLKALEKSRG